MMHQLDLFGSLEPAPPPVQNALIAPPEPRVAAAEKTATVPEEITVPAVPQKKKRGRKSLKEVSEDTDVIKELDKITLDKQYYSISEVAGMFRVNTSLIRYWENEFDILQPKKNRKGDRLFRQEDIQHLKLIYHLLRERKYTIEGAKQKLKEDKKLAARNFEMVQALLKVRGFLTELKDQL